MFQIIQSELYRIRKNRLFFLCLLLSTFFMFAYALTYHYDTVKTAGLTGGIASLNGFTEFLFSDYSLVIPMTIFQLIYVTEDYQKGIHEILFMKGVSRFDFFFGKLLALWIATLFYLIFSFFMAYLFILSTWIKQPYIEFSLTGICGYLILQILCFIGYSSFLWLLSCLIPYRNIVLVVSFFLLGTLYLYLTKISTALDLEYSLYKYWIVGLSDQMEINLSMIQLSATLITIAAYILFPTGAAYWIYQKADLRKHERSPANKSQALKWKNFEWVKKGTTN